MAFLRKLIAAFQKRLLGFKGATKRRSRLKVKNFRRQAKAKNFRRNKLKKITQKPKSRLVPQPSTPGVLIGEVTHYFSKISVVVLKLTRGEITVGDSIRLQSAHTDFQQKVISLQIESVNVPRAKKGQLVGLKVDRPAKVGDKVYRA